MLSHLITNCTLYLSYSVEGKPGHLSFPIQENGRNRDCSCSVVLSGVNSNQRLTVTMQSEKNLTIKECYLRLSSPLKTDDRLFSNGFQSWTESKEFRQDEKIPPLSRLFSPISNRFGVKNFGDSTFFKYSGKKGYIHGYSFTWIHRGNEYFFIGSLADHEAYTIFQFMAPKKRLIIERDLSGLHHSGEFILFDLLFCAGSQADVFDLYKDALEIDNPRMQPMAGWTSWYNYYTGVSEAIVIENLNNFKEHNIPLGCFQIDDGYQSAIGDWLTMSERFPRGMKPIAEAINNAGYRAGIWIAPFICQKRSRIYEDHFDWIVKDGKGVPIMIGYSKGFWDDFYYCLDIYNDEVREYIKNVVTTMRVEWGFTMFKVDFLYALTFLSRPDKTRAMVMSDGIRFIRQCTADAILLGCGGALAPGFGIMDYYRIGSDIGLVWEDDFMKKGINYRERVSTLNSLTSTIGRAPLSSRMFLNDPDVFILRNENNNLTREQKRTLFLLNQLLGDLLFTSDNIGLYDDLTLDLYLKQFPIINRHIGSVVRDGDLVEVKFSIERRHYIFYSNLENRNITLLLSSGIYSTECDILSGPSDFELGPFESVCFLLIDGTPGNVAGSDLHIFAGSAVLSLKVEHDRIYVAPHPDFRSSGDLLIVVDGSQDKYQCDDKWYPVEQKCGLHYVRLSVL